MARRILVLVSEPVSAEALRDAVGDAAERAEVLVVAPALNSPMRFWTSDADGAIQRAQEVQEETVERLDEEGIDAAGDTGAAEPLQAIQDALVTFDADEIVLFTHPEGQRNWAEEGVVEQAEARFDQPVRHVIVGG
jgi:GABA permease